MPFTIENIVDGFPCPSIPPIVGAPHSEKISEVHLQLNYNAVSVHSNLSDRSLGLLYLNVLPTVYNTLSATEFIPLMNPGPTPDITVGSTAAKISTFRYAHTTSALLFDDYNRTDEALFQQLLSDVDKFFVRSLHHRYVGYGTVSTCSILDHIYLTYANISPSKLQENETRFRASYYANHPIETLIYRVETAVEYAAAVNTPYSPAQVLATVYQLVFQTGLFNDNCKFWKSKTDAYKTWANFKVDLAIAHQEW